MSFLFVLICLAESKTETKDILMCFWKQGLLGSQLPHIVRPSLKGCLRYMPLFLFTMFFSTTNPKFERCLTSGSSSCRLEFGMLYPPQSHSATYLPYLQDHAHLAKKKKRISWDFPEILQFDRNHQFSCLCEFSTRLGEESASSWLSLKNISINIYTCVFK